MPFTAGAFFEMFRTYNAARACLRTVRHRVVIVGVACVLASANAASQVPDALSGARALYVVRSGESLSTIGARFGIEPRVLAGLNFLPADTKLRVGQWLVVDNRHIVPANVDDDAIVVNVAQRMLFQFAEGQWYAAYPVGVGSAGWPTFIGPFVVTSLEVDPVWDVPESIQAEQRRLGKPVLTQVPPGPANPLGKYWIGLDRPAFGIHGTNAPATIFGFRTHGCVRLHPDDISALFRTVHVGTRGRMIYEPTILAVTANGSVLLEAHPDRYRRQPEALMAVRQMAEGRRLDGRVDWRAVEAVLAERAGIPVDVTVRPSGLPTPVSRANGTSR